MRKADGIDQVMGIIEMVQRNEINRAEAIDRVECLYYDGIIDGGVFSRTQDEIQDL